MKVRYIFWNMHELGATLENFDQICSLYLCVHLTDDPYLLMLDTGPLNCTNNKMNDSV